MFAKRSGTTSASLVLALSLLCLLLVSIASADPGESPLRDTISFEGHVYLTDSTTALTGVTVELYSAMAGSGNWGRPVETTTDSHGRFVFTGDYAIRTDYRLHEVNPLGHISTGATAPRPGVVVDSDTVEYRYDAGNLTPGSYSGIVFYDRRQIITLPTPTNTRLLRPTPTRTATPTRTPVPPDFVVTALELTQGIQDLGQSVPLIAGKRTYVRAHVKADDGNHGGVLGEFMFVATGGQESAWLPAENPGGRIKVREWPGRGFRDHSYFIEVPYKMVHGKSFTVYFRMNYDQAVAESNHANNSKSQTGPLVASPPMKIKIFNVKYEANGSWHAATFNDIMMLLSWLRRAYPVPSVDWHISTLYWPYANPPGATDGDCVRIDSLLLLQYMLDGQPYRRYYGMVTDTGSWMRGCAADIPSMAASGPTGVGGWGWNAWDTDGSYGDFYGAHELGHAYGRRHTLCTGTEGGADPGYPYANGWIGVPGDGSTFYGWDIEQRKVYPPTWTDIMTYCSWEWISDYTYKALRNQLVAEAMVSTLGPVPLADGESLIVLGTANTFQGTASLDTLYRLTGVATSPPTPSDDWALALYDGQSVELARYPFTPRSDRGPGEGEQELSLIQESIPWAEDTARIAVEYQGAPVAFRSVSAHPPEVTILSPNGGESLSGEQALLRWEARDEDDDQLVFVVRYSADAGANWETVAAGLRENELAVLLADLPGSETALFRVIASDGLHTGEDTSDAVFEVESKPPRAIIISPLDGAHYTSGQMVSLVGEGYDAEEGLLGDESLSWRSDLQGPLGTGRSLGVSDLMIGLHTVELTATDGDGLSAMAAVSVYVDTYLVHLPLVLKP